MAQSRVKKAAELPRELWSRIASFAQRSDVSTLSKTSKLLESAAQQVLYRDVTVSRKKSGDTKALFGRLADRNWGTGKLVTSLTLEGLEDTNFTNIPFVNMPNLSSLSVIECLSFWKTSEEQNQFLAQIMSSCPLLRKLEVRIQQPNPDPDFSIPNLTHITWVERELSSSIFSLCVASRETITHLSIDFVECCQLSTLKSFLRLHFPNLRSFEFGPGPTILEGLDGVIVEFLAQHTTITHLHLFYELSDESDIYISPGEAPRGLFPRLEYLAAHPDIIHSFLEERVDFFHQSLHTLAIEDGLYLLLGDQLEMVFDECLAYKKAVGTPFSVRKLRLMLRVDADDELRLAPSIFNDVMSVAVEVFPELETWEGDISDEYTSMDDLTKVFSKFPRLRELNMYSSETFGYREGVMYPKPKWEPPSKKKSRSKDNESSENSSSQLRTLRGDMIALAVACPSMEVVRVGGADRKARDVCYISRGSTGLDVRCVSGVDEDSQ